MTGKKYTESIEGMELIPAIPWYLRNPQVDKRV